MNIPRKIILILSVLAVSACTGSNGFGNSGAGNVSGSGAVVPGSSSDPASPAYFQQTVGDRVLFLVDQSTLSPQGQVVLDAQVTWLLTNADYNAVIEGHADEQGTREYNLALGARRANSAREYLISHGVAGNRLKVVSFGKERPIEICSAESCYNKNRRAVTVLASGLTG